MKYFKSKNFKNYYPIEDFIKLYNSDKHCLFFGLKKKTSIKFSKEYVLPEWILERYSLWKQKVALPNGSAPTYKKSKKVALCKDCSTEIQETFESQFSELFNQEFDSVKKYFEENGETDVIYWLAIIWLKFHFRDRKLESANKGSGGTDENVEDFESETFHHIFLLARAFKTKTTYKNRLWSFFLVPCEAKGFDIRVSTNSSAIMLKLDQICLIAVFNDAGFVNKRLYSTIQNLDYSIKEYQRIALYTVSALINTHVRGALQFSTKGNEQSIEMEAKVTGKPKPFDYLSMNFYIFENSKHLFSSGHLVIILEAKRLAELGEFLFLSEEQDLDLETFLA